MNDRRSAKMWLAVVVLVAVSLACSQGETPSNGDRQAFNEEGFSFKPPAGSKVVDMLGVFVAAAKPDMAGDVSLGPDCSVSTYNRPDFKLVQKRYWTTRAAEIEYNVGMKVAEPQETTVAGQFGLVAEMSGHFKTTFDPNGTEAFGKLVMSSIDEKRYFSIFCSGPAARKSETLNLFDSLSSSVQFFDPITPTPVE